MKKTQKRIVMIVFGIVFFIFPILVITLLSNESFTSYIRNELGITEADFANYAINAISLWSSLLLGIIVYFQSKRINDLEETQYNTYLGIESVDYSFDFEDYFVLNKENDDFCVSSFLNTDKKAILTGVFIEGDNEQKYVMIPLVFVSKNQPLIVSLDFQKVNVSLAWGKKSVFEKPFKSRNAKIHTILKDNSRFVLGFGLTVPASLEFDQIKLVFCINTDDQNGRNQAFESAVILNKGGVNPKYYLTSSKTICL